MFFRLCRAIARSFSQRKSAPFPNSTLGRGLAGAILLCVLLVSLNLTRSAFSQVLSPTQALLQDVQSAHVVYLAETHDQVADHEAQLDLIQHIYGLDPDLAIGMEMFQRPYQEWLDQYLAGTISEAELRDRTEFDTRWGYNWEYYAPILKLAQAFEIPVIALIVPTEATRSVAQQGLEELDPNLSQWLPSADELELGPDAYRARLQAIYDEIHHGNSYSLSFDYFFLAQVLWDETMAAVIADYVRTHPHDQIIVLAGQGHIVYGYGIPRRVARRLADMEEFKQRSLLLNPTDEQRAAGQGVIADYFWPISPASSP